MTNRPWEDVKGVTHLETPTKSWDSFNECVMFHLQQVFRHDVGHDVGEALSHQEGIAS